MPNPNEKQVSLDQYLKMVNTGLNSQFVNHYKKNDLCLLSSLCEEYGSDKGALKSTGHPYKWAPHTYSDYYSHLFDHCRLYIKKVFECGIGTNNPALKSSMGPLGKPGASLRVWNDYFPNAIVIGADIDRDILFQEGRIKTYFVDQTKPQSIKNFWAETEEKDFDLMIDDGLHTFEAGACLFENSISRLVTNGIYIIEDVTPGDLLQFKQYFSDKKYHVNFINLLRPSLSLNDNNLIIIKHSNQKTP